MMIKPNQTNNVYRSGCNFFGSSMIKGKQLANLSTSLPILSGVSTEAKGMIAAKLKDVGDEIASLPSFHRVIANSIQQKNFLELALGLVDRNGLSPLHHAAAHGASQMISLLLEIATICHPNLSEASRLALVDRRDPHYGRTPLHLAVINQNMQTAQVLMEYGGSSAKLPDFDGLSPLHFAIQNNQLEMVEMLLEYGADPNQVDLEGATPLHLACALGHVDIVLSLIKAGAWTSAKDFEGEDPLFWAVRQGQTDVVRALAHLGCDHRLSKNEDGETPLDLCRQVGDKDMANLLLQTAPGQRTEANNWTTSTSPTSSSTGDNMEMDIDDSNVHSKPTLSTVSKAHYRQEKMSN